MIRKSDIQWWLQEARKHPEAAPAFIEELGKRLLELDAENERLRDELIRLRRRAPAPTRGREVQSLRRKVEALEHLLHTTDPHETSLVLLSDQLRSARITVSRARELVRAGDPVLDSLPMLEVRWMLLAQPHDELLLLTSQGRGLKRITGDIPLLTEQSNWPDGAGGPLAPGEWLTAAVTIGEAPRFWTIATRRGYVQRFVRVSFNRALAQGSQLLKSPFRNDVPVAIVPGDRGDVLVVTRWGKGVRFSQRAIETQGSVALDLDPDDEVVSALAVPTDTEILILTSSGYAARQETALFAARSRPGGAGKPLIQARDVLTGHPYAPDAELLYLASSGKLALASAADLPQQQRVGRGTLVQDMSHDPAVAIALIPSLS